MAIELIPEFTNRIYPYQNADDTFVGRGLHLNMLRGGLNDVITELETLIADWDGEGGGTITINEIITNEITVNNITSNLGTIVVTDPADNIGMVYYEDYSADGSLNDLWIPNIGYVEYLISEATFSLGTAGQIPYTNATANDLAYSNYLTYDSGTRSLVLGSPDSAPATIKGADGTVSYTSGANLYIYGGKLYGAGSMGQLYFGDGASYGGLANDEAETNVVAYDTSTGLLTYRSVASLGSSYTFGSGLTEAGGTVDWGGTANQTSITMDGFLDIRTHYITSGGSVKVLHYFEGWGATFYNNDDYSTSGGWSGIGVNAGSGSLCEAKMITSNGTNMSYIMLTQGLMNVSDAINSRGLVYASDYSTAGISYGARWIPDWGAVTTQIGGNSVNALITTPTVTQDGYAVTWDNTAGEYTLTAVGGGGVNWGTASNLYLVLGSASGDIESYSDLWYEVGGGDKQLHIDATGGDSHLWLEDDGVYYGQFDSYSGNGLRIQTTGFLFLTSSHATIPRVAIGDKWVSSYLAIGDSSSTDSNVVTVYTGASTALFNIAATGALDFNQYGSGTFTGTPAYGLAVDSSGNVIETAVGGGGVSWGTASNAYLVLGSASGDIESSTNLTFSGNTLIAIQETSDTSDVLQVLGVNRRTSGTAAIGIGGYISISTEDAGGFAPKLSIEHRLTDVTSNAAHSIIKLRAYLTGSQVDFFSLVSGVGITGYGAYSVAAGLNAIASATGSMAFGHYVTGSAQGSIIMGYHTSTQTNSLSDSFKLMWDGTTVFHAGATLGTQITVNANPSANLGDAANGALAYDSTDHEVQAYVNGGWVPLLSGTVPDINEVMHVARDMLVFSNTGQTTIVTVPDGAVIWDIKVYVDTVFDSDAGNYLNLGITGSTSRYLTGTNELENPGWISTSLSNIPDFIETSTNITFDYDYGGSAPTQGIAYIYVYYSLH